MPHQFKKRLQQSNLKLSLLSSITRLPCRHWLKTYNKGLFASDLMAAILVTVMLIPQSLAYALLAGLPPEIGLYASILPLLVYAIFGTSRTLSVGPVAVVSLMTAAALAQLSLNSLEAYILASAVLALLTGLILLLMGLLRLGFLADFLSHPVISGFISASALIIAASQLKHIFGVEASGHNLVEIAQSLFLHLNATNITTSLVGLSALTSLFVARKYTAPLLISLHVPKSWAVSVAKSMPIFVIFLSILATYLLHLTDDGLSIVGPISAGLPSINMPTFNLSIVKELAIPALLIAIVGFVESVSVGQTLAAKRQERIAPNQELFGLGAANIATAMSGSLPVTGGFSRSVVNFDAGAKTPAAGVFTAIGIALATLYLTPFLYYLPHATLAATIIIAVLSLVDFRAFVRIWHYSRQDFASMLATFTLTLFVGIEFGIIVGVGLSIFLHLYRTSKPHYAIVGLVEGSEHFRNIKRHDVTTSEVMLTLRIDESLYFANARFLEEQIEQTIAHQPFLKHLVLMCPAINSIDASALDTLEAINQQLGEAGIQLHLSEVKGPVLDQLRKSNFLDNLNGTVFFRQYDAWTALSCNKS